MEAMERIMDNLDFTAEQKLKKVVSLLRDKKERDFSVLVEKTKIAEEVKRAECQNREKRKNKREFEPSSSTIRPKKKAKSDGPVPTEVALCRHCGRRHLGECWRITGACLRCGSTEHRVRDCPLRTEQVQAHITRTVQPLRVVQQPPRGRDIGSTHSYVANTVSETLGILIEDTSSEMTTVSPLGQSIQVSKLYRDIPLEVQGTVFWANLMELQFGEFYLIFGMGWLVRHRISLDCATKKVVFRTEEDIKVVVIGECCDYLTNVTSALVAEKLVQKGCEAFLAYVSISNSRDSSVKDIRTVRNFSDVFPEELPRLPPSREVEFGTELFLDTVPVSITPYQIALKELTELKAQI
ncbi:uncharacterized protein [Gossypium hirsutum]|uniref:CCHC-type domain-containing protein n=1 Tax=Gossypium hirsutum TaxID=3635 RepID=A0ABM2ZEW0_GOSHI|nr:uncharacterized protein LOC121212328 [Gossypium hirsutum]